MKDLYDINDWLNINEHQRLGEILMQSGKINLIHLGMALDIQKFENIQLGEILLNMKVVSREDIEQALILQAKFISSKLKNVSNDQIKQTLSAKSDDDVTEEEGVK